LVALKRAWLPRKIRVGNTNSEISLSADTTKAFAALFCAPIAWELHMRQWFMVSMVLMVAWGLALASVVVTQAAENQPPKTTASTRAHPLSDTVKKDAKDVGSVVKESAHRVAVAAKAVAHEIASATKRGAAETRAAIKGEKRDTTSAMPAR